MRRRLVGVGQVELAVDQPLRALAGEVLRADRLAVHRDQPPAHHRVQRRVGDARLAQPLLDQRHLVGLDVDDEAVRRIGRRRRPPGADEIGAHHGQQQQRHDAHRQRNQLHDRCRRPPLHGGQREAPRHAELADRAQRRQQLQHAPGAAGEQQHPRRKAARGQAADLQVARRPHHQQQETGQPEQVAGERTRRRRPDVLAQHAQRRHRAQLRQRRQREAEQQHQAGRAGLQRRRQRRQWQLGGDQRAQRRDQHEVEGEARRHADRAGGQADIDEFEREQAEDVALRQPEAAHHGARIEVAQREAPARHRHRHRGDHRRQQRHQRQEALGALQRALHLRPAALERLELLAAFEAGLQLLRIGAHCRRLARRQQPVGDARARLDQLRRRQVGEIEHHARREVDELRAAVRLHRDDARHGEGALAQAQPLADLDAEAVERLRIGPHGAGQRHTVGRRIGASGVGGHPDAAAQRVARRHRLHRRQRAGVGIGLADHHAREGHRLGQLQAGVAGAGAQRLADRPVRTEHHVGAKQLRDIALQPDAEAVDQEADAGHRRHGDHQCRRQQPQLTGAPVARRHAGSLLE